MSIRDQAPKGGALTDYDRAHAKLYVRMLDAEVAGAAWQDVAARLLDIEPARDGERAKLRYDTHLARARWLRDGGYAALLES